MTNLTSLKSDTHYHKPPRFEDLLTAINSLSNQTIDSIQQLSLQSVAGGDINDSALLTLPQTNSNDPNQQQVFLKQNSIDKAPILFAEVTGLVAIGSTGARTCRPLAFGIDNELGCSFLILSVINPASGANKEKGWYNLAHQLVTLHQALPPQPTKAPKPSNRSQRQQSQKTNTQSNAQPHMQPNAQYNKQPDAQHHKQLKSQDWYAGWFEDNFIGSNPQYNAWTADWHEFFAHQRLAPQTKIAFDQHLINRQTVQKIEKIEHKLKDYLPDYPLTDNTAQPRPSLLHGDLWAGNAVIGGDSKNNGIGSKNNSGEIDGIKNKNQPLGYLIDPAVYVGHPETDIAMTKLFGGFTSEFYDAYADYGFIEAGFNERIDLYNLYHYLNHLNLFGTGYLSAVQRIAQRFGS